MKLGGFKLVKPLQCQVTMVTNTPSIWTQFETEKFSMDFPLAIGEVSAEVISIEEHGLQVRTKESFPEWPEQIMVSQHQFAISPADLAKHLDSFWKPIWNRDHVSMDFMQAESDTCPFHELLTHMPAHPQIQVDMLSREAWSKAVKKLKAQSARGTDKISAQELKLLPWCYLEKLAVIMSSYPQGFPASFMHGLICPLSKTDEIPEAKQTRPITLLPQLYRLWAAVMTAEITKVLCTWIPNDITGLLPRRGAANAAYFSQFHIEKARRYHKSISGLTLDIIKCFNLYSLGLRLSCVACPRGAQATFGRFGWLQSKPSLATGS